MDPDSVILAAAPVALVLFGAVLYRLDRWWQTRRVRRLERIWRLPSR